MGFGLCLIWGYCGILSFGHVAYYGLAGYAYGIIAGNLLGNSWGPILGVLGGLVVCTIISSTQVFQVVHLLNLLLIDFYDY